MSKKLIALTAEERNTVSDNIGLVEKVIRRYISVNNDINGLGFDDLLQTGSIGLCVAAQTFNGSVLFETYASTVIRNYLIDHCRTVLRAHRHVVLSNDNSNFEIVDIPLEETEIITDIDVGRLFYEAKQKYTGCVLKGIEALELKINGYSGKEIAAIYGVAPNLVGAWISKAVKQLRNDDKFMSQFR